MKTILLLFLLSLSICLCVALANAEENEVFWEITPPALTEDMVLERLFKAEIQINILEQRIQKLEEKDESYKCEGCGTTNHRFHKYGCLLWESWMSK